MAGWHNAPWMCFIFILQPGAQSDSWLPHPLTLADPFSQQAWREHQSRFFHLTQTFMADFVDTEGLPRLRLPTNRALFICFFGHPRTRRSYIIHNFSFNRKVPFMLRPPPLAAHKTPIPSCKAICLETLCGGHPCLSRAPACWWLFQSFLTGWQAERSRAHSPRPQASPGLPDPSARVCSSSPWFL